MFTQIRDIRQARGMSQRQLAAAAGVTQPAICRYENGRRIPSALLALRIAGALGVSVEYLAGKGDDRAA